MTWNARTRGRRRKDRIGREKCVEEPAQEAVRDAEDREDRENAAKRVDEEDGEVRDGESHRWEGGDNKKKKTDWMELSEVGGQWGNRSKERMK